MVRRSARGTLPDLASEDVRREAMETFKMEFYAASNQQVVRAKWRTITTMLAMWGHVPLPISVDKVFCLGASLKKGQYRSAGSYLSTYKIEAERHGNEITKQIARALKDSERSAIRGLGGPVKARALPLHRLRELPGSHSPWTRGGPVGPRNLMVVGAWFLLREVEASTARACSVKVVPRDENGRPRVTFTLPASKNDQSATGASRTHGCSCGGSSPDPGCPAHSAWDQLILLRRLFPRSWKGDVPVPELPLFPSETGGVCTKEAVTETILLATDLLNVARSNDDGTERVSGHSLRATGAQGLAAMGVEVWAIQLLGRWGSQAVLGYVREAALATSAEWARRAAESTTLESLIRAAPGASADGRTEFEEKKAYFSRLRVVEESTADKEIQTEVAEALAVEAMESDRREAGSQTGQRNDHEHELTLAFSAAGIAHEILAGPPATTLDQSVTFCGWSFGRGRDVSLAPRSALPKSHKLLCGKCFASLREAVKLEASVVARPMGS